MPELLEVVGEAPPEAETLLIIGHNPGLEELVLTLAADSLDDALDDVRVKFPTSAIAILAWHGSGWAGLGPGTALLTDMIVARGKKARGEKGHRGRGW